MCCKNLLCPFVVHVDRMRHSYSDLSRHGVQVHGPLHIPTMLNNFPEPTGANKLASVNVAKSDKPTSKGTSAAELAWSSTA